MLGTTSTVDHSRDTNGTLNATAYNADRSAPAIPVSAISFQGLTLRMTLPTMNATYEGRLSSDGNMIAGTLTQLSAMPLNLVRATPQTAWTIPDPPTAVRAMGNNVTPGIEVATIRPSRPDARGGGVLVGASGVLTATNTPLNSLIAMAYGVDQRQLSGAPSWVESDNFDIRIKPDREGVPNQAQRRLLWQALLADRFALKAHIEKEEGAIRLRAFCPQERYENDEGRSSAWRSSGLRRWTCKSSCEQRDHGRARECTKPCCWAPSCGSNRD
jgi:hypothetical protein